MRRVYIPLVGQLTNIGDTLHRSVLIEWLRDDFELHLYVGKADSSFISGLYLNENCITYKNFIAWYFSSLLSVKKSSFIYNPGEITGSFTRFLKELLLWPMFFIYKILGRRILKVGVDIRKAGRLKTLLYRTSNIFTNYSFYRTENSWRRFGCGEVTPDLGFYRCDEYIRKGGFDKRYVCISFRADRAFIDRESLLSIVNFSIAKNLTPYVIVQVREDNESARCLVKMLKEFNVSYNVLFWDDEVNHESQERLVNDIYKNSTIVVSDRLHVLIAACNNGAIPVCIAAYFSEKIAQHFKVIEFDNNVLDCRTENSLIEDFLEKSITREKEMLSRLKVAKRKLSSVKKEIRNLIG